MCWVTRHVSSVGQQQIDHREMHTKYNYIILRIANTEVDRDDYR